MTGAAHTVGARRAMTREEIRDALKAILRRLVPDADVDALAPDASLREQFAADSMDLLNFVVALHDELGVDVPELDYRKIETLDGCVEYVAAAIARRDAARPG
jgi:acyl carrier protein